MFVGATDFGNLLHGPAYGHTSLLVSLVTYLNYIREVGKVR
jgi:hypothetical protein